MSRASRGARAQATVETALLVPVVVLLFAALVQVAVVVRDQVHLTRATSAAARAAMVEPTDAAVRDALGTHGAGLEIDTVRLVGSRAPGGLLTVQVRARPARVPLVGLAIASLQLEERLVVRVEG